MAQVNLAQVVQNRESLAPDEDVAVITMHWRGAAPLEPDNSAEMDEPQRTNATSKISAFLTSLAALFPQEVTWESVVWYETFADGSNSGGRVQEEALGIQGTAVGGSLPPQVATSVSFRTAVRKNWGRFYLPTLATSAMQHDGRLTHAWADAIALSAAQELCDRGTNVTETLTVWSPTEKTHHDPQKVVVDDVLDIIRSRRFSATNYRAILDAG